MLVLGERIEFNPVFKPGDVGSAIVGRVTVTDSGKGNEIHFDFDVPASFHGKWREN